MINYKKKTLKNGLRVIAAPMQSEAVSLLFMVAVGADDEPKKINGVSHFLEHMFFKGTKNYPKPGQIMKELERMGASFNAFTGRETTTFWVKSSVKDFDRALDVVSDMVLNPLLKEKEIEKERGVIIQEINMHEDVPQHKVGMVLEELVYGDQPSGRTIAGTKESVSFLTRKDIVDYRNHGYFSKNSVLVVAGGIEEKIVFKKIGDIFEKMKTRRALRRIPTEDRQVSSRVKFVEKKVDQSSLSIGISLPVSRFDERKYILKVLNLILGGNTASILFDEIRQKLGLVYYIGSWAGVGRDASIFGVSAGVAQENLDILVSKITQIISRLLTGGVSKKQLKDAKSCLAGNIYLGLETTDDVADFLAERELLFGNIIQPESITEKIEKVTQNDILKLAREIFKSQKTSMAVVGPEGGFLQKEDFYKNLFKKNLR